jgi:hypothetical protein
MKKRTSDMSHVNVARLGVLHYSIAADHQIPDPMLFEKTQQFFEIWACQHDRT